jgi:hypothetical protein
MPVMSQLRISLRFYGSFATGDMLGLLNSSYESDQQTKAKTNS